MTTPQDKNITQHVNRMDGAVHLERIRSALLNNHAAVMIGSGFSLNAQYGSRLTMWAGLIDSLLNDLHTTEKAKRDAKNRLGGTSGMLRLAEEYAAVRGRAQLEAKMHELLPDAGVVIPGELHTKLLALPWTDVYTTNYDTLLERALDTDRRQFNPRIRRQYQVVVAAANVPFSRRGNRPRVVKLHGSLRSGTRLVVTEEDYRSYPGQFSPFVNTVQQSMLENVFCLIGFSGDDPNFLAWSGWVRDRLGDGAPPIYLISLSPISEGQRLVLERRNIIPVNISPLGTEGNSINYKQALGLLLDYWTDAPVRRRADWPYHKPSTMLRQRAEIENIVEWMRIATQNRSDYPGWLVPPSANRDRLEQESSVWQLFAAYQQHHERMPLWLRAVVMDEISWIEGQTFSQLTKYQYDAMVQIIELYRTDQPSDVAFSVPEFAHTLQPTDADLDRIIRRLAISAMRYCRESGNTDEFAKHAAHLDSPLQQAAWDDNDWASLHESLLLDLELQRGSLALDKAKKLALADNPSVDPYWRVRAGAILGEMGVVKKSNDVLHSALHGIRERIFAEGESVSLLSREQWAERILKQSRSGKNFGQTAPAKLSKSDAISNVTPLRRPEVSLRDMVVQEDNSVTANSSPDDDEAIERNDAARDSAEHPNFLSKELLKELDFAQSMLDAAEVDFDAEYVPAAVASPFLRPEAQAAAAEFCRFAEVTAYVPAIGRLGLSIKRWITAYRILSVTADANLSLRVFHRASTAAWLNDAKAIDMATVAELSSSTANAVFENCLREIKALTKNSQTALNRVASTSLRFNMDLISRVVFRLEEGQVHALLDLAFDLHDCLLIRSDWNIHRPYNLLLTRTLNAASIKTLEQKASQLLGLNPPPARPPADHWPDVAEVLREKGVHLSSANSKVWSQVVDNALEQAAIAIQEHKTQTSYFSRLDLLFRRGLMSSTQALRFSRLIYKDAAQGEVPSISGFYRAASLAWPSPDDRAPVDEFRQWILQERMGLIERPAADGEQATSAIGVPNEALLANVLITGNVEGRKFDWSESELLSIFRELRHWWSNEGESLLKRATTAAGDQFLRDILTARLRVIGHTLHRVLAPKLSLHTALLHNMSDWMANLWHASLALEAPSVPFLFAGLAWWPEREDRVVEMTKSVCASNRDLNTVMAAMNAAAHWLLRLQSPTDGSIGYVRHLVESVGRRNETFLDLKLSNIEYLLKQGAAKHFVDRLSELCASLCDLMCSLRYELPAANLLDRSARPILRLATVSLLIELKKAIPAVSKYETWTAAMEFARADPLLPARNLAAAMTN